MGEFSVALVDMPSKIKGFVKETYDDGENYYTIVLNASLNREQQIEAFMHELAHINNDDFSKSNVQEIESR